MTLKQAYATGKDEGENIGRLLMPKSADDLQEFISHVCECEENGREFSPFEFLAKEFNDSRNPDRTWEEYERGIINGATKAYRSRTKR